MNATEKVVKMIGSFKGAMDEIDKDLVERWVRDLVIVKTFVGLKFQEAILRKVVEKKGCNFRIANPREESKGIGGFLDETPISIKPTTYKAKAGLQETIKSKIIFYEKKKNGIEITFEDF